MQASFTGGDLPIVALRSAKGRSAKGTAVPAALAGCAADTERHMLSFFFARLTNRALFFSISVLPPERISPNSRIGENK